MQIVFFILIFLTITWFRQLSMVDNNTQIETLVGHQQLLTINQTTTLLTVDDKPSVLYFFAPWCQICHLSIENLESFARKNPHYHVVAIALDYMNEQEVIQFAKRHELTIDVALGNEQLKQNFQITGYPSYYVVDEQQKIKGKSLGYSTELGLLVRSLLK